MSGPVEGPTASERSGTGTRLRSWAEALPWRRRRGWGWWPQSLYGRTVGVLVVGLLLLTTANQAVNFFDRGSGVYRLAAQQTAVRIAEASRVLNRLPAAQRDVVAQELTTGRFNVSLRAAPVDVGEGLVEHDRYEQALADLIGLYLRADWKRSVQIVQLGGKRRPMNYEAVDASAFEQWIARHFYFLLPGTLSVVAQVRLEDGTTALFFARMPQEPLSRLESLIPRLLLNGLLIMLLAAIALATITRSLQRLAQAAQAVGDDPDGRAVEASGPSEVRSVILAFNTMRQRLRDQLDERSRMLAAISHDLRTPITRMRLRVELMDDPALRGRFTKDLDEMEALAGSTLEFMRTLGARPERRPVDVNALLASLAEDAQ
ncbi:MAG: Sensor protein RstB, partial [Pseudomonadota bacterium]